MSVLGQMMSSHRLVGGIVYEAVMAGEWSLLSQFKPEHCAPIFTVPERIVAYHYVRHGSLTVCMSGLKPYVAGAGTMLLFPRNDAHIICSSPDISPTPAEKIFTSGDKDGANIVRVDGDGPECALYCGWLGVDEGNESLLQALPPMIAASVDGSAQGEFLSSSLRYAAEELGDRPELVARLSQLFFEEAVGRYLQTLPVEEEPRLAALRDPSVARALSLIHSEQLSSPLTLNALAQAAGLSRTVLTERFVALLGDPPMRYRSRWRLRQAADMMRDGHHGIAEIAFKTGFGSEASFARAFKREFGLPPATWRGRQSGRSEAEGRLRSR